MSKVFEKIGEGAFSDVYFDGQKCIIDTFCHAKIAMAKLRGDHLPDYDIIDQYQNCTTLQCTKYQIPQNMPEFLYEIRRYVGNRYWQTNDIQSILEALEGKIKKSLIEAIEKIINNLKESGFEMIFFDVSKNNVGIDKNGKYVLFDLISIYIP